MYAFMSYENALLFEFLSTYITRIWTLPSMYAFMFYQSALLSEFLTTHVT